MYLPHSCYPTQPTDTVFVDIDLQPYRISSVLHSYRFVLDQANPLTGAVIATIILIPLGAYFKVQSQSFLT